MATAKHSVALPDGMPDVSGVEGYLSLEEAAGLFEYARRAGDGVLEVGTYYGKSTIALAAGRKAAGRSPVYAVDHGQGSVEHQGSIPKEGTWPPALAAFERFAVREYVVPVMKDSLHARVELDAHWWSFVFIDGAHERVNVATDAILWLPRIRPGGWIAFHDYSQAGQRNVVPAVDALRDLLHLEPVGQIGSIIVFRVHPERWE